MTASDMLSLTDMALLRLRKLADGNGIDPQKIKLLGSEEKTYDISGTLTLKPKCEVLPTRYPGGIRGKGRSIVADPGALQSEINRRRDAFMNGDDWVEISIKELKASPGKGWGLDDAHVTRPEKSAILACTSPCHDCSGQKLLTCNHCHGHGTLTCTQCNGQGTVICTQCQGQGRELCYYCGGRGDDPQAGFRHGHDGPPVDRGHARPFPRLRALGQGRAGRLPYAAGALGPGLRGVTIVPENQGRR